MLLEPGAEVNARDGTGMTALMHAASHGQDRLVQIILDAGADVSATDNRGLTARQWAEQNGHDNVAARLRRAK